MDCRLLLDGVLTIRSQGENPSVRSCVELSSGFVFFARTATASGLATGRLPFRNRMTIAEAPSCKSESMSFYNRNPWRAKYVRLTFVPLTVGNKCGSSHMSWISSFRLTRAARTRQVTCTVRQFKARRKNGLNVLPWNPSESRLRRLDGRPTHNSLEFVVCRCRRARPAGDLS